MKQQQEQLLSLPWQRTGQGPQATPTEEAPLASYCTGHGAVAAGGEQGDPAPALLGAAEDPGNGAAQVPGWEDLATPAHDSTQHTPSSRSSSHPGCTFCSALARWVEVPRGGVEPGKDLQSAVLAIVSPWDTVGWR